MMSYDGCCFFWHQHAQDGNHTISKRQKNLAMTKAMQHSLRLKDFCDKKNWEEPCKGQLSTMGKAMKAMKSPKPKGILKKTKTDEKNKSKAASLVKGPSAKESLEKGPKVKESLVKGPKAKPKAVKMPQGMKKPSAALALPNNDEGLSLEEKMEKFHEKGGKSVDEFPSSLTQGQRESLWGRFSRARDALKDEKATELWNETCKGKGSDGPKKQLLKVFLDTKGDLKKGNLFQKELIQLSQTAGGLDASLQWPCLFVCTCVPPKVARKPRSGSPFRASSQGLG